MPKKSGAQTTGIARKRRRRKTSLAQLARGIVLEGLGIAVLVFLFLAVQDLPTQSPGAVAGESTLEIRTESDHTSDLASNLPPADSAFFGLTAWMDSLDR